MTRTTLAALALLGGAALTGCGDGDDGPEAAPTATVTMTETATAGASDPTAPTDPTDSADPTAGREPNVGDLALRVGQWREGLGLRTRVIEVRQPTAAGLPDYLRDLPDASGAAVLVRSCVRKGEEATWVATSDFTARDKSGGVYESSGSSWDEWPPRPQYPFEREVRAGQCLQGWILLSAPNGTRITAIELSDSDGSTVAEWRV
ncbi:hypothetical protein ABFU82_01500 [Nocardioides sp. WV_118_6]|uniref:hypothetical protein n=1 Tax=Nocardioides simplex TaxID=2045 RepID=UPI0021506738|nr:hypothetical protein [Pimelobacter simplex]UUW92688.1 hypothetical protein M0M43_14755 [Pimelobacter simplex]UUW96516.1 hypothetical protein M0M48_03390 [Pimelobacter simplex]